MGRENEEVWSRFINNQPRKCHIHPEVTMTGDEDDGFECPWCEEVAQLLQHNAELRSVMHKQAVIVPTGGKVYVEGEVGLLECMGGQVTLNNGFSGDFPNIKGECDVVIPSQPAPTDR